METKSAVIPCESRVVIHYSCSIRARLLPETGEGGHVISAYEINEQVIIHCRLSSPDCPKACRDRKTDGCSDIRLGAHGVIATDSVQLIQRFMPTSFSRQPLRSMSLWHSKLSSSERQADLAALLPVHDHSWCTAAQSHVHV